MTNIQKKHALKGIGAGVLALALLPQTMSAVPITGSISFNGNVTPFINSTGGGGVAADYSQAHSLVFGQTLVSAGADGSFASVTMNSLVNMFSPLQINSPALPSPSSTPLWTTAVGGFSFTLSSLTEDTLVAPFNTLTLRGTGTLSDGNLADNTSGTWVATFTEAASTEGVTFSWNSSSKADTGGTVGATESGSTCMLLGFSLVCLGVLGAADKRLH